MNAKKNFEQEWPDNETHRLRRLLDMLSGWYCFLDSRGPYMLPRSCIQQEIEAVDKLYGEAQNLFVNDEGQVPIDQEVIQKFVMEKVVPLILSDYKKEE